MNNYVKAGLILLLIASGMTLDYKLNYENAVQGQEDPTDPYMGYHQNVSMTEEQKKLSEFFVKHGSPQPAEMAIAVSKTKYPALLAAVAIKESNGDPTSQGDGNESHGAFQVQPRHWGPVSKDPNKQALQAERILDELLEASKARGDLRWRTALARYNGGSRPPRISYRYADKVIRTARSI